MKVRLVRATEEIVEIDDVVQCITVTDTDEPVSIAQHPVAGNPSIFQISRGDKYFEEYLRQLGLQGSETR